MLPPPSPNQIYLEKRGSNSTGRPKTCRKESNKFSLWEKGLNALPTSLTTHLYANHDCSTCNHLSTPQDKSLHHHKLALSNEIQNIPKSITTPKALLLSNEWEYKAPPIFCTPTTNIKTAILLQQLLEYGLTFQLHQPQAQNPFLSPFEGILNLEHNIPPLTHFTLNNEAQHTYNHYDRLLQQLKQHLRVEKLQILSTDKGSCLILIPIKELTELYQEHLQKNATKATIQQYNETLRRLKLILYLMEVNISPQATTDDRPPTCYFKIKTHKLPSPTTQQQNPTSISILWAARSWPVYQGPL